MEKILQKNGVEVLLIHMPMCEIWPSVGLSLLKSALLPLGVSTEILYFSLQFAKLISPDSYLTICEQSTRYNQTGEWIFSGALFEQSKTDIENYIEKILRRPSGYHRRFLSPTSAKFIRNVLKARGKVDRFLNECEHEILSYHPRIVGFSSTYQQQVASLALAKRIKKHSPNTFIAFGGPNCEGIMGAEMIRQFSFIDAVVSGKGDILFPQLVQRVLKGKPLNGLQGAYTQTAPPTLSPHGHYLNAHSVHDMDSLSYSDYDDFFDQLERSGIHLPYRSSIPIETSRGCWWGERGGCTFCAYNSANRKYYSKTSQRALNELTYLLEKYPVNQIRIIDNILNTDYFKELLPELAARRLGIEFFCDVRPTLTKQQVRILWNANFKAITVGIESLSSPILRLMRKGVSQLQNVQLLKWCKEFGIKPFWNLLWGFPFEPAEEYERMARLIPLLVHLSPAQKAGVFQLARFSPYFENTGQFGLTDAAPSPAYRYIYPFSPEAVFNLAYFFTYKYRYGQNLEEYIRPVIKEWIVWKRFHDSSDLFFVDKGKKLFIWDQRPIATQPLTILSDLQRVLYIASDRIQSLSQLRKIAEIHTGRQYSREEIEKLLQPVMDKGLMIREGNRHLSLAIPVESYVPRKEEFDRFQKYLRGMEFQKHYERLMKRIRVKEAPNSFKIPKEEMMKFKI